MMFIIGVGRYQQFLDDVTVRRSLVDPVTMASRIEQQIDLVSFYFLQTGLNILELDKLDVSGISECKRCTLGQAARYQANLELFRIILGKSKGENEDDQDR
jgi:hypothetical protein